MTVAPGTEVAVMYTPKEKQSLFYHFYFFFCAMYYFDNQITIDIYTRQHRYSSMADRTIHFNFFFFWSIQEEDQAIKSIENI